MTPTIINRSQYDDYPYARLDEQGNLVEKLKDPSEATGPETEAAPMTEEERLKRAAELGREARLELKIEEIIREN